jgi:type I restriction enzyme S subunit
VIGRYGSLGSVHWVEEPFWPLNTTLWVKDFKGNDPRYISYLLGTIDTDSGAAAAVPGVNRNHLHRLVVRVPSVAQQRKISALLGAFDDLIALSELRIDILDSLAKAAYANLIPASLVEISAPRRSLPSRWQWKTLGEIAGINCETISRRELPGTLQYLDIAALASRRLGEPRSVTAAEAPGRARRLARDGDTLWSMVRPNRRAHALIHEPPHDLVVSTGIAVITPRLVPSAFVFEYASTRQFSDYLAGRATGAAYPAVKRADFASAPVAIPPEELLQTFAATVDSMHRANSTLTSKNRVLKRVRGLLLPCLLTGKLNTSDVDLGVLTPAQAA